MLSPVEVYLISFLIFIPTKLIVVACSRPSEDRTIPLSVIAERTKLSIENVEHLLMKSLSVSCIGSSKENSVENLIDFLCNHLKLYTFSPNISVNVK